MARVINIKGTDRGCCAISEQSGELALLGKQERGLPSELGSAIYCISPQVFKSLDAKDKHRTNALGGKNGNESADQVVGPRFRFCFFLFLRVLDPPACR